MALVFDLVYVATQMSAELLQKVMSEAGCSRSTVYRALQGNPLVSVATREKVQAAAGRIGFRLNPMVGEWMAKVRNPETVLSRLPMLYLAGHSRAQYREIHFLRSTWQGARQRARELGFSIEIWHVAQMQQDWERIVEKIRLREIRGVIIARFPPGSRLVDLPWPDISTVGIGFTALHPPIHTLASHGFETMRYAMEELRKRGYERPAYLANLTTEQIGGARHTADFLSYRETFPAARTIPILRLDMEKNPEKSKVEFLRWFRRYRPDVLLNGGSGDCLAWLKQEGIRVPKDVGYFYFGLRKDFPCLGNVAGIPQPGPGLGRSAVDVLASMLYHRERGLPARPTVLQTFTPTLVEGHTLRGHVGREGRAS